MYCVEVRDLWKKFHIDKMTAKSISQILKFKKKETPSRAKEFWALKGINFSLNKGESLGVIGVNGSGKSTMLKLLTGVIKPTAGQIQVNGNVSAMIELGAGFHPDFTGRDNVYINGLMIGMEKRTIREKFDEIVAFAELEDFIDVPVKYYSSGMQARLGFAIAVANKPDVLIVDEVLAVGDINFQNKCKARIREMLNSGTTLLLVSHGSSDVLEMCQKALWLHKGEQRGFGSSEEVMQQYINFQGS